MWQYIRPSKYIEEAQEKAQTTSECAINGKLKSRPDEAKICNNADLIVFRTIIIVISIRIRHKRQDQIKWKKTQS